MHSELVLPVLVGLFFAFAPGVCVLVAYAVARVRSNEREIERTEAGERRMQAYASKRKERHANAT